MDTPAAALMRRTEAPACPYFFKQRRVASISASRRTAGVARRNFGTCRFFFIEFPLISGVQNPSWILQSKRLGCAIGSKVQSKRTGHGLVRQLTRMHVEALRQPAVF